VPDFQVPGILCSPAFEVEFLSDLDLHSWKHLHSLAPAATQNLRNAQGPTDARKEMSAVTIAGCIDDIRSKVGNRAPGLREGRIGILDSSAGYLL